MSQQDSFCLSESWYCPLYNFLSVSFVDRFNNIDLWALSKTATVISLEICETLMIASLAHSKGLSVIQSSIKGVNTFSTVIILSTIKEVTYSYLVTNHLTPNTFHNLVQQWEFTYNTNNSHSMKSVELLSNVVIQVEAGSYQFGNILRVIVGGSTKLISSIHYIAQGSYSIPIYIGIALSGHYFVYYYTSSLFAEAKETLAEMRTIPFKFTTNNTSIQNFTDSIEKLRLIEQKQLPGKLISSFLIFSHENMMVKGGAVDTYTVYRDNSYLDDKERSKEILKLSEPSYLVKWTGEQYFRFIDLWHRLNMINKFVVTCINDRSPGDTPTLPPESKSEELPGQTDLSDDL